MIFKNVGKHLFGPKLLSKPGDPPGVYSHKIDAIQPQITSYFYDRDSLEKVNLLPTCEEIPDGKFAWISINGHGDRKLFERLEKEFNIHLLTLEDVVNTTQLPKIEEYENYLFIVGRIPSITHPGETEQIILIVFDNVLISIQEWDHDYLDPIHKRMLIGKPRIRSGPGYLSYAILDLIVDSYFPLIEMDTEKLDRIEEAVFSDPNVEIGKETIGFKKRCGMYRKILYMTYETVIKLNREGYSQVNDEVSPFLRDCADHANQANAGFEMLNSRLSDILNLQLSLSGARLNEVMKYLTLIATIFIPLTFIAGIYGMNFNTEISPFNMPELNWYFGYPAFLTILVILVIFQIVIFKKKGWLGKRTPKTFEDE